jgi:hypothetical protein
MPYALLQLALDQTISREELEEASMAAPNVARADCAVLQRELFGIVVGNLPHEDALALQAALRARNFPTELVEQSALPALPPPKRETALKLTDAGVALVDLYGRERLFAREQLVFGAAGYVVRLRQRVAGQHEEVVYRGRYGTRTQTVTDYRLQDVPEFRLEMFASVEPYRLQWVVDPDNTIQVNGGPVALRHQEKLDEIFRQLAVLLPAERVNLGIRKLSAGGYFVYPSARAFEEEIVWSFYQLTRERE